jgi:ATP-dependent Lon protease
MLNKRGFLLPLRYGDVLGPGDALSLFAGRPASTAAVRAAFAENVCLILATLRDPDGEMSAPESIFGVGVQATAMQLTEVADGVVKVFVDVNDRVRLRDFTLQERGFYRVESEPWPDAPSEETELRGLARLAFEHFDALRLRAGLPDEANKLLAAAVPGENFSHLPWAAVRYLGLGLERHWISHERRQELLEAYSLSERLRVLINLLDQAEPPVSLASKVTPLLLRGASYL